jgi:GH35 family endo-1,4-beta-xylanase
MRSKLVGAPEAASTLDFSANAPSQEIGVAVKIRSLLSSNSDGEDYREFVKQHRYATVADALRPVNFKRTKSGTHKAYTLSQTLAAIDSLKSWGLTIKGHFLIRGDMQGTPMVEQFLKTGSETDFQPALDEVLDPINATYPEIVEWDFLNHPWHYQWNNQTTERLHSLFIAVKEKYPNVVLGVNEGKVISASNPERFQLYIKTLELFQFHGIQFDFVGVMGHFATKDPVVNDTITARTDQLKRYGSLIITEFDLRYGRRNTLSRNAKTDIIQVRQTKSYLKWITENKDIVRLISWGFWEPEHWYPNAAYFEEDWMLTPNGDVYIRHFQLQ